ncbi:hypothetical protein HF086_007608 [Spodoptera exigua]|uniref:Uncharacterized protein n=1 Tax=Spodoptera exigua TaxID=7107 RepID=A0A922MSL7_SPOEX|nr:hypothetical protein HF086_007608 [Spodoptera exigua]
MRRPEDEELGGRGDGDEFVDISQMQLLVEAGPSGLHYGGPPPPHAQPQPYAQPPAHPATTTASVDDLFALYFTPTSHGEQNFSSFCCSLYHDITNKKADTDMQNRFLSNLHKSSSSWKWL